MMHLTPESAHGRCPVFFDFQDEMLHGAHTMTAEEERTRLIGEIARVLREDPVSEECAALPSPSSAGSLAACPVSRCLWPAFARWSTTALLTSNRTSNRMSNPRTTCLIPGECLARAPTKRPPPTVALAEGCKSATRPWGLRDTWRRDCGASGVASRGR